MRQTSIGFKSNGLNLEGIVSVPDDSPGPFPTVVICHSHPALSGNMGNEIVTAISDSASEHGIASLRFNFRGVGESEGHFSNGQHEIEDLKTALKVARIFPGLDRNRIGLVGHSFGASIILRGLKHYKSVNCFVLISPPISSIDKSKLRKHKHPKFIAVGDSDRIVDSVELKQTLGELNEFDQFLEIPGAGHDLKNHEKNLASKIITFVADNFDS